MSLLAEFVDWLESKQSPETQRIMQHFDHHHTREEAKACLHALRESNPIDWKRYWITLSSELAAIFLLIVLGRLVFDEAWAFFAWACLVYVATSWFAHRYNLYGFLYQERKPIKWPCRRLS